MPRLPFKNLPKNELSPQFVLNQQLNDLWKFYSGQEENLQNTPMTDTQYVGAIRGLQTNYDARKQQILQRQQQLEYIQQFVDEGVITPEAGQRAMWRMVMPTEIEQEMFAKPTEKAKLMPFSPTQLASYGESIDQFAKAARTPHWYLPANLEAYPRSDLIKQYLGWRDYIGYDVIRKKAPIRADQLDAEWDDRLRGAGYKEWDPNAPEIKALRPTGRLQQAAGRAITKIPKAKKLLTVEEFEKEVARLKTIDMNKAKKYYNENVGRFK